METFLILCLILNKVYAGCPVSFGKVDTRPNLISAYNDGIGPSVFLAYYDQGLQESTEKLLVQFLRHPGGTFANYWSFANATFVTPCNGSGGIPWDYCWRQQRISHFPNQTFSPGQFYQGIGGAGGQRENVYVLNLYTLDATEQLQQIDILNNEVGANNIKHIELGNELYIWPWYNDKFPNSRVYMRTAAPLISKIKQEIPNAKLSIPINRILGYDIGNGSVPDGWNDYIAENSTFVNSIDAVTIHDYNLDPAVLSGLSYNDSLSVAALYGQAVVPQYVEYVQDKFGDNMEIWMTEYNWNVSRTGENQYAKWDGTVIHSMFIMGYISAAVCEPKYEILGIHEYAVQEGGIVEWNVTWYTNQVNDKTDVLYGIVGEINAHLQWIAKYKQTTQHCLSVDFSNNQCMKFEKSIENMDELSCIFGVGFSNDNDANSMGWMLVNACSMDLSVDLNTKQMTSLTQDISITYWIYNANDSGSVNKRFSDCGNAAVWECGPVVANTQKIGVGSNNQTVTMNVPALSLMLATNT